MKKLFTTLALSGMVLASCQNHHHDASTTQSSASGIDTIKTDSGVTVIKNKEGKIITSYPTRVGPAQSMSNKGNNTGDVSFSGGIPGPYYIYGRFIHGAGANMTLDRLGIGNDIKPLDAETVDKEERFGFVGSCSQPQLMQLRIPAGSIHFVIKPNDTVQITATLEKPGTWEIKGSPESNQLFYIYNNILEKANGQKDIIETRLKNARNDNALYSHLVDMRPAEYAAIDKQKHAELRKYITKIEPSFTCLLGALYLDPVEDVEFLKELDKKMVLLYPASPFYQALHEKVSIYGPVAIGMLAPEIISKTTAGETVKLSSLRGKYTLIDFWASWCGPCRAEAPNIHKAWEKYKNKGFQIVSYSLDTDKKLWIKAIEDDDMTWTNLSDLLGYQSAAAGTYVVTEIPYNFLLDKEGHIIAKNLRGADLQKKLSQLIH
jgi:peroxiredoxin